MTENVINLFEAPEGHEGHELSVDTTEEQLERWRQIRVDELVLEYLGTRDRLDTERHAWQKIEAELKGNLDAMSMVMREKADALGVDNLNIRGVGTAYRNTKTSYRIRDWPAFTDWLDRTKNFQCLEKRVAKLATAEIERDIGEVPPGVDKNVEVEFLVRRTKA